MSDLYVIDAIDTLRGTVRLLNGGPLGRGFGVRLPSGMTHWFPTIDDARGSQYWPAPAGAPFTPRCECVDPECRACWGACDHPAPHVLWRVDMLDEYGTPFCRGCAIDALDSGTFTTEGDSACDE